MKKHFCEILFLENKTILHIFLQINRFFNTSQFVHFYYTNGNENNCVALTTYQTLFETNDGCFRYIGYSGVYFVCIHSKIPF